MIFMKIYKNLIMKIMMNTNFRFSAHVRKLGENLSLWFSNDDLLI
jgi:hypothetical protein